MDKARLLAALREETLPRLDGARAALEKARATSAPSDLEPVRELCHRVAGTGAVAGLPSLSRIGHVGEAVAQLVLEGEAKVTPRLCAALEKVLAAIGEELAAEPAAAAAPRAAPTPEPVAEGKGRIGLLADEVVSRKLMTRVLEDAGFEVLKGALGEGPPAGADTVVLDVPADEALLAKVEASLAAATQGRIPVILTGKPESSAAKTLGPRVSQFLAKPVAPDALETAARTLVARRRMAAAARSRAPTAQLPAPTSARARSLKVLIVDDSRVIRGVVREALGEVGLQSVEAEDGAAALKIFDAEKPDAVISDVQMPGLDGAQLTRLLRERSTGSRLPIVVLSALDDAASRKAGLDAGADAYLVKNVIDGPALLAALKSAGLPL